jgi:hypothetical protein
MDYNSPNRQVPITLNSMQNDALDLAFARHVRQVGLVSPEQISSAMETQSRSLQKGVPIPLPEAMVQMGIITAAQRETLEKKVKEQQAGAHQLGPYRLVKKLGEGGMGAVYLAVDSATSKNVAVKVLPRHFSSNAEFVKRFRREAEMATQLRHPNIVGAFATGEDLGYHYYVMEFCEGETLDSRLKRERTFPVAHALGLILQAAQGLHFAHQQGIVHRDIKPPNLFLMKDGTLKILDLGLSKFVDDPAQSFKTVTGAVLGTPHYISPEQAQGEKDIDGRTDIYSLGATLYHLLTGQTPFDGTTVLEILSKHVNVQLPNPQDLREDLPDPVVQVLQRMMAKSPRDRYRDCGALIDDLEQVIAGRTPKTQMIEEALSTIGPAIRRAGLKRRAPSTTRRIAMVGPSKAPWVAAGSVGAAALLVLAFVLAGRGGEPVEPPPVVKKKAEPPAVAPHSHGDPPPPTPAPRPSPPPEPAFEPRKRPIPAPAPEIPESPIEALTRRLREANPSFDGPVTPTFDGDKIIGLTFTAIGVTDLGPLSGVTTLRTLDVSGRWDEEEKREYLGPLADLAPLRGLALEELHVHHTGVADVSPLRGMPLRVLDVCACRVVVDLEPLRGMMLNWLDVSYTGVKVFDPLRGMPLRTLNVTRARPDDLSFLRSFPLKTTRFDPRPEDDLGFLAEMKTLESINFKTAAEFLRVTPLAPLIPAADDAWKGAVHLLPLVVPSEDAVQGTWKIAEGSLRSDDSSAPGLLMLPYKPPEEYAFRIVFTPDSDVPDVNQILSRGGRAFQWLNGAFKNTSFGFAQVDELDPKLLSPFMIQRPRALEPRKTSTAIVEVRKDAISASVNGERLVIIRPAEHKLKLMSTVKVPDESRLGLLTFMCSAAFHAVDVIELKGKGTLIRTSRPPMPVPPEVALWKNAVDLIAVIDPSRDAIRGIWRKEGGRLVSEPANNGVLRLPYEPPVEYDFRIAFTRTAGKCATAQFLARDGHACFYEMGGYGMTTLGFSNVNGAGSKSNATGSRFSPRDNIRYVSTIQVRRDRVTAFLDDKKVSEWRPEMGTLNLEIGGEWCLDLPTVLGVGNCETLTVFDAIQVREVTGKGRVRTTYSTPMDGAFVKAIPALPADQLKRVLDKLKDLNPAFDPGQARSRIENDRVVELTLPTQKIFDLWPVRGLPFLRKLELGDEKSSVLSDIGCLRGMKLQELGLTNTRVSDLTSLVGMPLLRIQLQGAPIKDYAPLRTIRSLRTVNDQPVADFLKGR